MDDYTEKQRKEITRAGYKDENWHVGHEFKIDNKKTYLGKATRVVRGRDGVKGDNPNGLDALVVKDPKTKTIRVIYQGSRGNMLLSKDWTMNDWPMAGRIMGSSPSPPPVPDRPCPPLLNMLTRPSMPDLRPPWVTGQLKDASRLLKKTLKDNPGYSVEVYGHSLGSMDGQYAVSSLDDAEAKRVKGAWLYEGPNIYPALPEKQKRRARSYGYKVKNYVDPWDFIAQGYADDSQVVGQVQHVHSVLVFNPVKQHLWGGYRWNPDGSLKIAFFPLATDDYMNNLSRLRASWGDGRKLSASQGLFLDSELALVQEQACDKGMADLERTLETLERQAAQEADVKWGQVVSDVQDTIARDLDRSQVEDALRAAGWTRASFTRRAQADARDQFLPVRMVIKDIYATGVVTRAGIQKQLDADASLAADFNEWDATIYENTKKKTK